MKKILTLVVVATMFTAVPAKALDEDCMIDRNGHVIRLVFNGLGGRIVREDLGLPKPEHAPRLISFMCNPAALRKAWDIFSTYFVKFMGAAVYTAKQWMKQEERGWCYRIRTGQM